MQNLAFLTFFSKVIEEKHLGDRLGKVRVKTTFICLSIGKFKFGLKSYVKKSAKKSLILSDCQL